MDLKSFCALLLAAGLGAGSTEAVRRAKAPAPKPKATRVAKPAPRQPLPPVVILDCPLTVPPSVMRVPDLPRLADAPLAYRPARVEVFRPPAPVPEPGAWAMLVAGFGMIGISGRWRRRWR